MSLGLVSLGQQSLVELLNLVVVQMYQEQLRMRLVVVQMYQLVILRLVHTTLYLLLLPRTVITPT